jgi:GAF domain-containing protein
MSAKNTYEVPLLEDERLAALQRYEVLDTAPEQAFDELAFLAGTICATPVALITFVDADRQWFKARIGLSTSETPRDVAFCARTILGRDLMVITDTHRDARFRDNPLVTGAPYIRFYAGAPLRTSEEMALGSLCVIDYVPRVLSQEQRLALKSLGRLVVLQLDARRQALQAREPHANGTPHG